MNKEIQSILEEWRKVRTDAISDMFAHKDIVGIYPTTKLFNVIDTFLQEKLELVYQQGYAEAEKKVVEKIISLPREFWEDEDHAVGGYISKKDLKSLLSTLSSKE